MTLSPVSGDGKDSTDNSIAGNIPPPSVPDVPLPLALLLAAAAGSAVAYTYYQYRMRENPRIAAAPAAATPSATTLPIDEGITPSGVSDFFDIQKDTSEAINNIGNSVLDIADDIYRIHPEDVRKFSAGAADLGDMANTFDLWGLSSKAIANYGTTSPEDKRTLNDLGDGLNTTADILEGWDKLKDIRAVSPLTPFERIIVSPLQAISGGATMYDGLDRIVKDPSISLDKDPLSRIAVGLQSTGGGWLMVAATTSVFGVTSPVAVFAGGVGLILLGTGVVIEKRKEIYDKVITPMVGIIDYGTKNILSGGIRPWPDIGTIYNKSNNDTPYFQRIFPLLPSVMETIKSLVPATQTENIVAPAKPPTSTIGPQQCGPDKTEPYKPMLPLTQADQETIKSLIQEKPAENTSSIPKATGTVINSPTHTPQRVETPVMETPQPLSKAAEISITTSTSTETPISTPTRSPVETQTPTKEKPITPETSGPYFESPYKLTPDGPKPKTPTQYNGPDFKAPYKLGPDGPKPTTPKPVKKPVKK